MVKKKHMICTHHLHEKYHQQTMTSSTITLTKRLHNLILSIHSMCSGEKLSRWLLTNGVGRTITRSHHKSGICLAYQFTHSEKRETNTTLHVRKLTMRELLHYTRLLVFKPLQPIGSEILPKGCLVNGSVLPHFSCRR